MTNKYAEIINIINSTLVECDGEWLTLEDQLCMAKTQPESPWKALDIAEVLDKISERDNKIASLMVA